MSNVTPMYKPGDRHPTSKVSPDPLTGLRFIVTIAGEKIGSFQECTGLAIEYEVFSWEEGGENRFVHKLRGRAKYPNIVLKRGVTNEDALIKWFHDCSDKAQRKNIAIMLKSADGQLVRSWGIDEAFPVKWTGPTLNAGQAAAAVETLEIVHKGFSAQDMGLSKG